MWCTQKVRMYGGWDSFYIEKSYMIDGTVMYEFFSYDVIFQGACLERIINKFYTIILELLLDGFPCHLLLQTDI